MITILNFEINVSRRTISFSEPKASIRQQFLRGKKKLLSLSISPWCLGTEFCTNGSRNLDNLRTQIKTIKAVHGLEKGLMVGEGTEFKM